MADTLEEICNVSVNLSQLQTGYQLFDLPATDGFVIRDLVVSNPKSKKVQLLRNGSAFRTLECSASFSGFEVVPKDATMSLSTTASPVFNRLQSVSGNQILQTGGTTIFDDSLPATGQSAYAMMAPISSNVTYLTVSTAFSTTSNQFCLMAGGNFYYTDSTGSSGGALYRRAGGFNGAETTLWSGMSIATATYDQATGILYAIQVGGSVWKRYDTVNSTALADVSLPAGLTSQSGWSASAMAIAAYNNVLYCSIMGAATCHIVSGVASSYVGNFNLTSVNYSSYRHQIRFSKNKSGDVYFIYISSVSTWQVFSISGGNPSVIPTIRRVFSSSYNLYYNTAQNILLDLPGTDWVVGYDGSSGVQLLNPATLQSFSVSSFSVSGSIVQQGIDNVSAMADYGQIGVRMTGVRFI